MNTNGAGLVTPYLKHEFGISTCVNGDPLICTLVRELTSRYCGTIVDVNRVRRNKLSYKFELLTLADQPRFARARKRNEIINVKTYPNVLI